MPTPGQILGEIVVATADPAAGGEIVYTADQDMIVHSLRFTLVTSAAVANRLPSLSADDGNPANEFFRYSDQTNRTASTTTQYCAFETSFTGGVVIIVLPLPAGGLKLRKGDRLRTITSGLDAGDDYSAMKLQVEHL